jgi:hypothetical protein
MNIFPVHNSFIFFLYGIGEYGIKVTMRTRLNERMTSPEKEISGLQNYIILRKPYTANLIFL